MASNPSKARFPAAAKRSANLRFAPQIVGLTFLVIAVLLGISTPARAADVTAPAAQETEKYCLGCHSNPDKVKDIALPSGETLSLVISADEIEHSIHSSLGIECEACHNNITTYPHPAQTYTSRRELSLGYYQTCQKCHSNNYEKAQDSIHTQMAASGHPEAPVCTDCHGAHDVRPPNEPRAHISETCAQCHGEIVDAYKQSIHGAALIGEDNPDVPVCTDCHGVHDIQDPRTEQFRVQTPEMCANCHADEVMMSQYGLPADVYDIYKLSWHGVDVSVYKARWPAIWHDSAVCTDCHGIHDIRQTDDPASKVNPANLQATCAECHPGAGPNWTAAWTGHNEISLARTPFVFYVKSFYDWFMPVVLWASVIYVLLQIVRNTAGRVRRNLP
jgi:nitrate/TMAO reductase-like tetraheme cytochrome c subunit